MWATCSGACVWKTSGERLVQTVSPGSTASGYNCSSRKLAFPLMPINMAKHWNACINVQGMWLSESYSCTITCPHVANTVKTNPHHVCWEVIQHPVWISLPVTYTSSGHWSSQSRDDDCIGWSGETSCFQLFPAVAFEKGIQHLVTQWNASLNVGSDFVLVTQ